MRCFVLTLLVLAPLAAQAEEGPQAAVEAEPAVTETWTYRIDPKQSALWVTVYNDTSALASRFAHDHAIAATDFEATVAWNLADASQCRISFDVPVTKLWPDPPGFRERAGIDPADTVSESAKSQIVANFLSKRQLDGATYPTITFRSTTCSGTAGTVSVTGDLTIRGVTKRVTVPMKVTATDTSFAAEGVFELQHSDFGFDPFANLGGAVRNLPKLRFGIDVKGAPVE